MDVEGKQMLGIPWMEDPQSWYTTEQSLVVEMEGAEASVAAGVIAAVIIGVLATIALLFSFALLIDCRNKKRALEQQQQQQNPGKRKSPAKRATLPQFISNSTSNRDDLTFVNQMCTDSITTPPTVFASTSEGACSGTMPRHSELP